MTPFAHFYALGWCFKRILWRMSAVVRLASYSDTSLSILKLSLSGPGAFFWDWSNSTLLTLFSSTLWWVVPSQCSRVPFGSAGGDGGGGGREREREDATLLVICLLSSREVAVVPSWSIITGVVENAHGLVYRNAVHHCSLYPRISFDTCRKVFQHYPFPPLMV